MTTTTRQDLETQGVVLTGVWGGPQKQRYYTPTGDEVWAIPSIREWARKDATGKIVARGERDSNLDRGWTFSPPAILKLHCRGCDQGHDSPTEVAGCIEAKAASEKKWEAQARRSYKQREPDADVATLQVQIEELKDMVAKLMGGKE